MRENGRTVVVIDGGGRGSALVERYSKSPHVRKIIAIPGNDLMQANSKVPVSIFKKIKTTDITQIINICKKYKVDLIDVAQDDAIEVGLVDKLSEQEFNVVGPTRAAGQIEWDKAWSRDFMRKYKIPSPKYKICNSKKEGIKFINSQTTKKWFIKAAGLAGGKGALPAKNKKEAIGTISQMSKFGKAGKTFVIEQWLTGEEFSMFAISDGNSFQIVGSAQDHKRLYDGDSGPNTGGMGCSAPPLVITKDIHKQSELIIAKTLKGMSKENRKYKGVLYLGGIVVNGKVFVIEFNARWGDPEAEVIIPGIKSDIFEIGMHIAKGNLSKLKIRTDGLVRVAVTGSLRPEIVEKKRKMLGVKEILKIDGVALFGARVTKEKNNYFVLAGRLFHVVGKGKTVIQARQKAYRAMSLLSIEGNNLHYRTDIGHRDVERLQRHSV